MPDQTTERAFESYVEIILRDHAGWQPGELIEWDVEQALFPARVFAFLQDTQRKLWAEMGSPTAVRRWSARCGGRCHTREATPASRVFSIPSGPGFPARHWLFRTCNSLSRSHSNANPYGEAIGKSTRRAVPQAAACPA